MSATIEQKAALVVCPNCRTKNRVPATGQGAPRCGKCHQPLPWVVDASDADFTTVADEAAIPVLVDIWAPWCGPCRMVSPALEKLAQDLAGRIKLVKVNADESPEVSRRFNVEGIPTLVLLQRGQVVDTRIGAAPANVIRTWLNEKLLEQE